MCKLPKWSFEYIDNGGGHQYFFVRAKDKAEAIDKGMKRAKLHAKGDCNKWDCHLIMTY